jgi:hypothetical protein
MGTDPKYLGYFKINLCKIKLYTRELTDEEYEEEVEETDLDSGRTKPSRAESESSISSATDTAQPQNLWDADKVDEKSFKNDGITQTIGLVLSSFITYC